MKAAGLHHLVGSLLLVLGVPGMISAFDPCGLALAFRIYLWDWKNLTVRQVFFIMATGKSDPH